MGLKGWKKLPQGIWNFVFCNKIIFYSFREMRKKIVQKSGKYLEVHWKEKTNGILILSIS